ncbi:MAG: hypothetical protein WDA75_18365, partial [Candidatus Latescibacterota bacterium]
MKTGYKPCGNRPGRYGVVRLLPSPAQMTEPGPPCGRGAAPVDWPPDRVADPSSTGGESVTRGMRAVILGNGEPPSAGLFAEVMAGSP